MVSSRVAELAEDVAGLFGVEMLQVLAPFQVAGAGHGIGIARDHPAAEVLAAGGEAQRFGGVGAEA